VFEQDPRSARRSTPARPSTSRSRRAAADGGARRDRPDRDEAVAALARADLEPKIVEVYSDKDTGTVTGQSPKAGEMVKVGTRVQINVSRGVRPLTCRR
jgi:multidrug resistance efflux pump